MRQVVLDTETTGLEWRKGNRVVEIGCVELLERRPTGRTFHCYLNPDREFEPGAQEVTGLTLDFLADKPRFAEVADEFLAFVEGAELVLGVRNPRPESATTAGDGVGLRNSVARLRLLYGDRAKLRLDLSSPGEAIAQVRLPA